MSLVDRNLYVPGPLPTLGPAGFVFADAIFSSRMARTTDELFTADLGTTGRSFATCSAGYQQEWNADSTKFFVVAGDGNHYLLSFNQTTMATARIGNALPFSREPATFDPINPNIIYGVGTAVNHHTIVKVDVSSLPWVTTTLLDLDSITTGLGETYIGALCVCNNKLMVIYGGSSQEYMRYILWWPLPAGSGYKVIDTFALNGMDEFDSKFTMHSAQMDKSGRSVDVVRTVSQAYLNQYNVVAVPSPPTSGTSLTVTSGSGVIFPAVPFKARVYTNGSDPYSNGSEVVTVTAKSGDVFTIVRAQNGTSARTILASDQISVEKAPYNNYFWDTTLNTVAPCRVATGGHEVLGWDARVNQDVLASAYDGLQWILTPSLLDVNANRFDLITPVLTPQQLYIADHSSWNNATAGTRKPVLSAPYKYFNGPLNINPRNAVDWRCWDNEILLIDTVAAGGTVTRFCHHRSQIFPDIGTNAFDFYYTPRANIDCLGRYALFTSNWEKSLGIDTGVANTHRVDVFVVELVAPATGPSLPPIPSTDGRIKFKHGRRPNYSR